MKKVIVLLALLSLIFVAACGGGVTPAPYGEPTRPSKGAEVIIENFAFHPATLTVVKGSVLTWTNQDSVPHTIAIAGTESPELDKGDSWSYTFDTVGTFDYICGIHPYMKGQVIVQ